MSQKSCKGWQWLFKKRIESFAVVFGNVMRRRQVILCCDVALFVRMHWILWWCPCERGGINTTYDSLFGSHTVSIVLISIILEAYMEQLGYVLVLQDVVRLNRLSRVFFSNGRTEGTQFLPVFLITLGEPSTERSLRFSGFSTCFFGTKIARSLQCPRFRSIRDGCSDLFDFETGVVQADDISVRQLEIVIIWRRK